MGLGGFFKKLFGKGDEPVAATAAPGAPAVPGAVDTVGAPPPMPEPVTPMPAAAPEKTA